MDEDEQTKTKRRKELEKAGCKYFVCPNLNLIDDYCKELHFDKEAEISNFAKDIATQYFKKTYHHPKYVGVKPVLVACIYIASDMKGERRTQDELKWAVGYGSTAPITKWYMLVCEALGISIQRVKGHCVEFGIY